MVYQQKPNILTEMRSLMNLPAIVKLQKIFLLSSSCLYKSPSFKAHNNVFPHNSQYDRVWLKLHINYITSIDAWNFRLTKGSTARFWLSNSVWPKFCFEIIFHFTPLKTVAKGRGRPTPSSPGVLETWEGPLKLIGVGGVSKHPIHPVFKVSRQGITPFHSEGDLDKFEINQCDE